LRWQGRGLRVGLKEYTFGGNKRRYSYLTVTAGRLEGEEQKEDKQFKSSFLISTKSKKIKAMNPTNNGNIIPSR